MWVHLIHYFLHLIFPILPAKIFFKTQYQKAYGIMLLTMLVDVDHLLATPIFDPNRCSIAFHPLHTFPAMIVYALLCFFPGIWRMIGIGLCLHMATDALNCYLMH